MAKLKEKRRGGVFDETIMYVNYTREQLIKLFQTGEKAKEEDDDEEIEYEEQ